MFFADKKIYGQGVEAKVFGFICLKIKYLTLERNVFLYD